jgi:hypothetical protein
MILFSRIALSERDLKMRIGHIDACGSRSLIYRDARAGLAREPEFAQPSYLGDKIAFTKAERAAGMRL